MAKKFLGIKPFSFQRDVINEVKDARGTGKTIVVKSRRQVGKTTLISNLLLFYAINYEKTKNYCLSPTLKQGKSIYKTVIAAISGSGVIESKNATDLVITLVNGSTISFKSGEQRESLRGETCSGILCIDEAAYLSDDIFNIVKPWCDFHKAVMLIVSTPFVKSGFFWRYYNYGLNRDYNTVTIDWADEKYTDDMNLILSPEKIEEYRKTLPKNVYIKDYLGLFIDDDGSVFTDFKKCVKAHEIGPKDRLYVGIDWAAGNEGDDTAISILNQNGQQVYLEYFNSLSPTKQIDRIEGVLVRYINQIVVIQTELNSLGTPLTDFLKDRPHLKTYQDRFVGFNTTNQSKNAIVQGLQLAFEQGLIEILDDQKQLNELATYTAEYNPKTRNVSYNAPNGLHDDINIALMLSYDAYKNGLSTGNYAVVSTVKKKETLGRGNEMMRSTGRRRVTRSISYIGK